MSKPKARRGFARDNSNDCTCTTQTDSSTWNVLTYEADRQRRVAARCGTCGHTIAGAVLHRHADVHVHPLRVKTQIRNILAAALPGRAITPAYVFKHVEDLFWLPKMGRNRTRELLWWANDLTRPADHDVQQRAWDRFNRIKCWKDCTACRWCNARGDKRGIGPHCRACGMPTGSDVDRLGKALMRLVERAQQALVAYDEGLGFPTPTRGRPPR